MINTFFFSFDITHNLRTIFRTRTKILITAHLARLRQELLLNSANTPHARKYVRTCTRLRVTLYAHIETTN